MSDIENKFEKALQAESNFKKEVDELVNKAYNYINQAVELSEKSGFAFAGCSKLTSEYYHPTSEKSTLMEKFGLSEEEAQEFMENTDIPNYHYRGGPGWSSSTGTC